MRNFKDNRRSGGRSGFGGRDRGPSQMYRATCSDCGDSCEVPFKPTPGKSVLCSNCFGGGRGDRDRGGRGRDRGRGGRDFGGEKRMHKATCADCGDSCEVPFKPTGEKPVLCSNCFAKGGSGSNGGGRDNGSSAKHTEILVELAELHEQQNMLAGKIDKIIALLQRGTPIKEHIIEKPVEEPIEEPVVKKKTAKKAAVKKVTKKVVVKKTPVKKSVTKKIAVKKKTTAKKTPAKKVTKKK